MKRRTSYKPLSELTSKYKRRLVSQIIADPSNTTRIEKNSDEGPQTSSEGYMINSDDIPSFENDARLETRPDELHCNDTELNVSGFLDVDHSDLVFSSEDEGNILIEAIKVNPEENVKSDFREDLAYWAVKTNIKRVHLNGLLRILRKHSCFEQLPKDGRTLLSTPRKCVYKTVSPGQYFHFGIEKSIQEIVQQSPQVQKLFLDSNLHKLSLQINIDGVPLTKSSTSQFWPILGLLNGVIKTPFVIGTYHGVKKPECSNEFLEDFVFEAIHLSQNGINVMDKKFDFKIACFVCDAPAKAFIKKVKGHTGYYGCDRCTQKGLYVEGRTTFPEKDADLRTDDSFISRQQQRHHTGDTSLEQIPNVKMVSDFPHDYMHLVCLGAMRKLLLLWTKGSRNFKLSRHEVEQISSQLSAIVSVIPNEFQRTPRPLSELDRWKATELRQFLLYTGPLVLKPVLRKKYYTHFLTLSTSIRILTDPKLVNSHTSDAKKLLRHFFDHYGSLYGVEQLSYNVHSLIHLVDDVKNFGPLDSFSAFKFENHLQKLKNMVSKSSAPLSQLVRRVKEERALPFHEEEVQFYPVVKNQEVVCSSFKIKAGSGKDDCVQLKNGQIVVVDDVKLLCDGQIVISGKWFETQSPFFKKPYNSESVGIFRTANLSQQSNSWKLIDVERKAIKILRQDNSHFVATLLHH